MNAKLCWTLWRAVVRFHTRDWVACLSLRFVYLAHLKSLKVFDLRFDFSPLHIWCLSIRREQLVSSVGWIFTTRSLLSCVISTSYKWRSNRKVMKILNSPRVSFMLHDRLNIWFYDAGKSTFRRLSSNLKERYDIIELTNVAVMWLFFFFS